MPDSIPRPQSRAKITASFPRARDLVFQAVVQSVRVSQCEILNIDRTNHHLRFSFALPSGRITEHELFVFDAVGGASDVDIASKDSNENYQFDALYQCIVKELSKFLLFASEPSGPSNNFSMIIYRRGRENLGRSRRLQGC